MNAKRQLGNDIFEHYKKNTARLLEQSARGPRGLRSLAIAIFIRHCEERSDEAISQLQGLDIGVARAVEKFDNPLKILLYLPHMGLFGKKEEKPKKLTPKVLWEQYYRATQEQDWAGAVEALLQLRKSEPENDKIPMRLGDSLQRMGNRREAVAAYHEAASATVASGFAQKALAIYKIILRLEPGDGQAQERSRDILEGIETMAQQQAIPGPQTAAGGEAPAFEGYGSLDMPPPTPEAPEGMEPTGYQSLDETEFAETVAGAEDGPGMEIERTAYDEEPGELPPMESLVAPEPMPDVEPVQGLELTAYEDEPDASVDTALPEGLEHSMQATEEEFPTLSTPMESVEPVATAGASGDADASEAGFRLPEVFAFLLPEERDEFIAKARLVPYAHGEAVISEGETGDAMYIIRQGTARVVTEIMGREVELALLGPGDFFGEVAFLTGRPRTASVVALGELELLEIDRPLLEETIDKNPLILDSLVELYHSRAQDTVEKVKSGRS